MNTLTATFRHDVPQDTIVALRLMPYGRAGRRVMIPVSLGKSAEEYAGTRRSSEVDKVV